MKDLYWAITGETNLKIATKSRIVQHIDSLSDEQQTVLFCRYGVNRPKLTLEQTATVIGKSGSRVRQIEAKTLRLIRERLERPMSVVSNQKLSANQIASIVVQSNFSDEEMAVINAALKSQANKNKKSRIVAVTVGDTVRWTNGRNDKEYDSKVLRVTECNVWVRLFGRDRQVSRQEIVVVKSA